MRQHIPLLTGLIYGLGVAAALLISPRKLAVIGVVAVFATGFGLAHHHLLG